MSKKCAYCGELMGNTDFCWVCINKGCVNYGVKYMAFEGKDGASQEKNTH